MKNLICSLEGEVWKPVIGYEALYQVSNKGRVKMIGRSYLSKSGTTTVKGERMLIPFLSQGYYRVSLVINNKNVKKFNVHRLVAFAFIPNHENKLEVNHKNGVKTDNFIENLEWCTRSENAIHACVTGLTKPMKRGNNPNSKRILCTTLGLEYACGPDAAEALGLDETAIKRVANNIRLHTQGLVFRFL